MALSPRKKKVEVIKPDITAEPVKAKKISFPEFLVQIQGEYNSGGFRGSHHPDLHYLGASDQCPRCDRTLDSAEEQYEKY